MRRLRPMGAALAAVCACALLQGAVSSKVHPDAGWPACVAVLLLLTVPVAALLGLACAGWPAERAGSDTGFWTGVSLGAGLYLAPAGAALAPEAWFPGLAAAALALWLAASLAAYARARPLRRLSSWRLPGAFLAGAAVLCVLLAWATPPGEPRIGRLAAAGEAPAARGSSRPNCLVVWSARHGAEQFTAAWSGGAARGSFFPGDPSVRSTAAGLARLGYFNLAVSGHPELRRARRFGRGFHYFDDSLVSPQGWAAAWEAVRDTAPWARLLAPWIAPPRCSPAPADIVVRRALAAMEAAPAPFYLAVIGAEVRAADLEALRAGLAAVSAERGWWLGGECGEAVWSASREQPELQAAAWPWQELGAKAAQAAAGAGN